MNNIIRYFSSVDDWNLALHILDDESNVIDNRIKLAKKLSKNISDFIFMDQIHSWKSIIVWKNEKWLWSLNVDENVSCDSMVTNEKGIVLSVLVADCLPILFFDENKWIVWVAHAWWRWTKENVAKNTINNMLSLWSELEDIKVEIWPSISKDSYEVWHDVWCYFKSETKSELNNWKCYLDLKKQNYLDLLDLGIKEDNIKIIETDTFTDNKYYSARRDWFYKWRFWGFIYIK